MTKGLSIGLASILIPLSSFGLTLEQAVQHVTSTNPIILQSIENYKATEYDIEMAQAGYLPSIDVIGRYGNEKTTNSTYNELSLTRYAIQSFSKVSKTIKPLSMTLKWHRQVIYQV